MEERAKYEKWLRDLDAKKEATPAHVFQRVRGDYLERLDQVSAQLREHTNSMQEHARTLMARLKELEEAEQDLKDEQTEQELRAQVGELSEGEWESIQKKAQRAIAKLQEDQESVADDLNQIRQMLEGKPEGEEEDEEDQPRRSTDFNELEFLKSVVGSATPSASSTPPKTRSAPVPSVPSVPSPASVRATPTGVQPRVTPTQTQPAFPKRQTPAAVPAAVPPVVEKPPVAAAEALMPAEGATRPQAQSDSPLSQQQSAGTDQRKSLKCAECGTMNSPNEWYCERCGAELANI